MQSTMNLHRVGEKNIERKTCNKKRMYETRVMLCMLDTGRDIRRCQQFAAKQQTRATGGT